jgi:Helix-turn-helix domain
LSQRERDRLRVLHEVEQGHRQQREAARRLRLSDRQVRRLQARLRQQGDGGLMHGLRGRRSNHKISEVVQRRGALRQLSRSCYVGFGPTLAAEHLAKNGIVVSRETLRKWMGPAGLWKSRPARVKALHVWRPRRASFGELVMMDSSPFRWLEDRGPAGHRIARIDDATSRVWGRLVAHDSTEENLRTLQGWLLRWGRPLVHPILFPQTRSALTLTLILFLYFFLAPSHHYFGASSFLSAILSPIHGRGSPIHAARS